MTADLPSPPEPDRPETVLADLERWSRTPMMVLSLVWLGLVVIEMTRGASRALEVIGVAIWVVFVAEFALRLHLAPRKRAFVARNWLTVLSLLVPAFRLFRFLRVLRVLRAARAARGLTLVRVVGGANRGMNALRNGLKRRGAGYVAALTTLVALLGAAGMQTFEQGGPNAEHFDTFGESLWWTAMLLTTSGSKAWPRTPEGRFLCFLLALYAFSVFGYLAAALASVFVDRDRAAAE
jgi:voltage-gated potassium channel